MSPSLRVAVAPDSFGGALSSVRATSAIAAGWSSVRTEDELLLRPMADGGEGTLEAIAVALGEAADRQRVEALDPLGRPVQAEWLLLDGGRTAFVEMAAASGLARLAPHERDPRRAHTRGTGQLVRAALDAGVERLIVGFGGSATNDAGAGIFAELGARFLDAGGRDLPDGGAALARLARIELSGLDARLAEVELTLATDVTNPLCGPRGASAIYGPQKGADEEAVAELDAALATWGAAVERATGRLVADLPGAGAAGGTAAGFLAMTAANLRPGAEVIAELVGLADALEAADLVITGEGRADEQTLAGKTGLGVATLARARSTPVVLLCGALGPGAEILDVSGAFALVQPIADRPMELDEAIAETDRLLRGAAARLARGIGIGLAVARP